MPDYVSIHTGPVIDQGVSEGLTAVQPGDLALVATTGLYADILSKPATFTPSAHSHIATDITDFIEAVQDAINGAIVAGTNISVVYNDVLNTYTISANSTNLSYTPASRLLESSTGTDVTLPLFSSLADGLVPGSGGGITNFLRADGSWVTPSGGGSTDLTYTASTRLLESSTGADVTLPLASIADAGLAAAPEDGPDRFYAFHDCLSVTGNDEFSITVSGTGAALSVVTPPDGGIGWARLALGTVATNRGAYHGSSFTTMRLDLGRSICRSRSRLVTLSDATNTYSIRSGFIDTVSAESVDGVFFRYTHSVNGGRWEAVCRSNNVETAQDTGITAAISTTYKLEVDVNATGTSAAFRINGTLTNTITTNIPIGAGRETGYGFMVLRSVGTAAVNAIELDYIAAEQRFTGR